MLHTGRNLTAVSAGIVVYILSGADFRAAGIGGISWDIDYPGVIKLAALIFWVWLVYLHWLTRKEGEYYKAWADNAVHYQHKGVASRSSTRTQGTVNAELQRVALHFGVQFNKHAGAASRYGLQFVDKVKNPGIRVVQCTAFRTMEAIETGGFRRSVPQWDIPAISDRVGILRLHLKFRDVAFRTLLNSPEVLSRRIVPWVFAAIALVVMTADACGVWVSAIGPWIDSLFGHHGNTGTLLAPR